MNHFPSQRITFASPPRYLSPRNAPLPPPPTVQQLQFQNQQLKRQLSELLKVHNSPRMSATSKESSFAITAPFSRKGHRTEKEEDVEACFGRKMSKLKEKRSQRSRRQSVQYMNATTPSSPRKGTHQESKAIRNITNLNFRDSPFKKMIIEQDEKGNFFRNKQKEDNTETARNNIPPEQLNRRNSQQSFKDNNVERFSNQQNIRKIGTQTKNQHRRVESFGYRELQSGDATQRIVKNTYAKPPFYQNIQVSLKEAAELLQLKTHKAPSNPTLTKMTYSPVNSLPTSKQSKENTRPSLTSPRGNVYIQETEQVSGYIAGKILGSQQSITGDSLVSIQVGPAKKNKARKLKYDVYMDDDK